MMTHRQTIGFIIPNIIYPNENRVWAALTQEARLRNINLISIVGEKLKPEDASIASANAIYRLVRPGEINGVLIWTSLMGWNVTLDEVSSFVKGIGVPAVSMDDILPGIPSVVLDNYGGICRVIEHMIKVHGRRRIAFIRGPEDSAVAELRFSAYKDTLRSNGIELDPALITPAANWMDTEMIQRILSKNLDSIDCIVSVSDYKAIAALEYLYSLGVRIPEDIAVVGFDDDPRGRALRRPLTTINPDHIHAFVCGLEILLEVINGGSPPAKTIVPARLITRETCGCISACISGVRRRRRKGEGRKKRMYHSVVSEEERWLAETLSHFLGSSGAEAAFIHELENYVEATIESVQDEEVWHQRLSDLRKDHTLDRFRFWKSTAIEDLIHQARVAMSLTVARKIALMNLDRDHFRNTFLEVCQSLVSTFDLEDIFKRCTEGFQRLKISFFCIRLYVDTNDPAQGSRIAIITKGGGAIINPGNDQDPVADDLIPDEFFGLSEGFRIVAMPLYFQKDHIGLVLFGDGPDEGGIYQLLRGQLSSALKGILLMRQIGQQMNDLTQANEELARSYNELRRNQKALIASEKMASLGRLTAGIAHEMNTPIAAIRASLRELDLLVEEYRNSINTPEVTEGDHLDIANDMMVNITIASRAAKKSAEFIRGIKSQINPQVQTVHELFNACELASDTLTVLEFLIKKRKCTLVSNISNAVFIFGNPRAFGQILSNIVVNAVDACSQCSGTITVSLTKNQDNATVLTVSDTGKGIDKENLSLIFDPFFTTKPLGDGMGLGLSIVYELVNEFGGTIEVESVPGDTVFRVIFPFRKDKESTE